MAGRQIIAEEGAHVIEKAVRPFVKDAEQLAVTEGEQAARTTFGRAADTAVKTTFGTGKGAHVARVSVMRDGRVVSRGIERSGTMTEAEKALGFPRSTLATHTEARAVRNYPMQPGDHMSIDGQYPPCPSGKGATNRAHGESGGDITYRWPDGEWKAGRRR